MIDRKQGEPMLNRKYYPYERNRYYAGKLLTARDFEAEQQYFNDKRRLHNRLTGANGVVAGMGVIRADDSAVIVQSGCAYDAAGREIVVPETQVVKLSTLEGYAQLTTDCALLGIRYEEQPDEETYAALSGEDGSRQANRLREQYRLYLLDESAAPAVPSPLDGFVARQVLYADAEVEISQRTPRYLVRGSETAVYTELRRLAPGSGTYSFLYQLAAPGFLSEGGEAAVEISLNDRHLSCGESAVVCTRLAPQPFLWGGASAALTASDLTLRKGDGTFTLKESIETLLKPVDRDLTEQFLADSYAHAMDEELSAHAEERLWLARIRFLRQKASLMVDAVEPQPFGQLCCSAPQLMTLRALESYYPAPGGAAPSAPAEQAGEARAVTVERAEAVRRTASGSFDFPLGMGADARTPLFSEEIMHGLGRGPVWVEVGLENIAPGADRPGDSEILLGDARIFGEAEPARPERLYGLSTAVKVLPERGTFIVGVRLDAPTSLITVRMRWFAVRMDELEQKPAARREGDKLLMVNPDTFVLQPRQTAHISPTFINMPGEACSYAVVEPGGGTVDNNGVYTAPAREGVYEIRVSAISDPTVYTHVFAVVTMKKKEEAPPDEAAAGAAKE